MAEPALSAPRQAHDFLDGLDGVARQAFARAGSRRELDLDLAGERVHLRFAGPALADVMGRAFEQVMRPRANAPGLVVDLWDSASTGTVMPPPPWDLDAYGEQGKIRGLFGDGLFTLVHPGSQSLTVLSLRRRKAWFWVRSAESLGTWEGAAPLLTLLHLWLAEREVGLLHAAAVGTSEGCLLVVGPTNAGKSTTALTGLEFGLDLLADDYCLLRFEPDPVVHALFSCAKASDETLARLPSLAPRVANPERGPLEKAMLFPHEWAPERLLAAAPVRGIVVPRVVDRPDSQLAAISSRSALAALAPSTLFQLPGSGEAQLRRLGRLARSVPCHRLDAGSDPGRVVESLSALLERA